MTRAVASLGLFVLVTQSVSAALVSDVAGTPYEEAILDLQERGIIRGYDDGTYRPDQAVNRAELLKVLIETEHPDYPTPGDLRCFDDFLWRTAPWYAKPVCIGRELGIVQGYPDGTFRPDRTVNLVEAIKMVSLTLGFSPTTPTATEQWYEPYLSLAREAHALLPLLKEPDHILTRGEMAELIERMMIAEPMQQQSSTILPSVCGNGIAEPGEQCDDGNMTNGDGCSELCISVSEPIRHAILRVSQEASATITSVSAGKKGVALLRFSAEASRQDALLTSIEFEATEGSLTYGKNYALVADSDGNGTYDRTIEAVARTEGSRVVFDALDNVLIPDGIEMHFEVRADIAQTTGPITLAIGFATSTEGYVTAVGAADGRALTGIETDGICAGNQICWLQVFTRDSTQIAVNERGNLYVTASSTPIASHQVLAGATSDPVLSLKLRADGEDIDVTMLRIEGSVTSIESLNLLRGATVIGTATTSQCSGAVSTSRFCADLPTGALRIEDGEEVTINVVAKIKSDSQGAVSGQSFGLSLTASTTSAPAVEAEGISSNQSIRQNDGDGTLEGEIYIGVTTPVPNSAIIGQQHDVVLAKIASVANGASAGGSHAVPSGTADIGAFTITTLPHSNSFNGSNDVVLSTFTFSVSAPNVQLDTSSFAVASASVPSVTAPCTASAATGLITVTCSNLTTIQNHIDQNDKATYILRATVTNPQVQPGTSSLQVSLSPLGNRNGVSAIEWSDEGSAQSWVDVSTSSVSSMLYSSQ